MISFPLILKKVTSLIQEEFEDTKECLIQDVVSSHYGDKRMA